MGLILPAALAKAILLFMLHKSAVGHPFLEARDPGADRFVVARAQTEAVAAARVNVQLRWNAGALEPQIRLGQPF